MYCRGKIPPAHEHPCFMNSPLMWSTWPLFVSDPSSWKRPLINKSGTAIGNGSCGDWLGGSLAFKSLPFRASLGKQSFTNRIFSIFRCSPKRLANLSMIFFKNVLSFVLFILDSTYKWNHMVFGFLCLLLFLKQSWLWFLNI